ncbi:MAG: YifB family Mg chelatase-like AAA ATPase [Planctomycetota bacterium]|nr:YifB family Mg chelatase-like AAA ATPase [Planctomycetota bacterium]
MLARCKSCAIYGVDVHIVDIEVDISSGLPSFTIVGLPDAAIKESRERVRSAIKNCNYEFPPGRITVNLAPAAIKKEGSVYDLAIALAILTATGQISAKRNLVVLGELSLSGKVRSVRGVLPSTIAAREQSVEGVVVPEQNALEASYVRDVPIFAVKSLADAVEVLRGVREPDRTLPAPPRESDVGDFLDVRGQEASKRALVVASAGMHNILMVGPPGCGKSMMARRLPSILPPLSEEEALQTSKIHSIAGVLDGGLLHYRPFRAPHHTISDVGLVGGGIVPQPGEVSLAHNGVLFMDEFPLFSRAALDALREPLEEGKITVTRANYSVTFPSRIMLVGSMNPCHCGHFGDLRKACRCSPRQIQNYRAKVPGPLLDRIDIHIEVGYVDWRKLGGEATGESSETLRKKIAGAWQVQQHRFANSKIHFNSQMTEKTLKKFCPLVPQAKLILDSAMENLKLSARAYSRIIKVARTIADLEGEEKIREEHIAEAVHYRTLDRRLFE